MAYLLQPQKGGLLNQNGDKGDVLIKTITNQDYKTAISTQTTLISTLSELI